MVLFDLGIVDLMEGYATQVGLEKNTLPGGVISRVNSTDSRRLDLPKKKAEVELSSLKIFDWFSRDFKVFVQ